MQTVLTPRREFWLLMTLAGIQFTHVLDFMIIMPLGPQLRDLFAINDAQFGFLVSAYTFAAGASGLLAASFVDRFERKRLLLVLYVLFALTTLACALAPSYGLLMAARVAAGTFGGILSAMTQTVIGDVIPFERRGRATGFVMTSFAMATVVGVPSGLFLANMGGWHSPFFCDCLDVRHRGCDGVHVFASTGCPCCQSARTTIHFCDAASMGGPQSP